VLEAALPLVSQQFSRLLSLPCFQSASLLHPIKKYSWQDGMEELWFNDWVLEEHPRLMQPPYNCFIDSPDPFASNSPAHEQLVDFLRRYP